MAILEDKSLLADSAADDGSQEIYINTTAQTIKLVVTGDLTNDGISEKTLYSFIKDQWKDDPNTKNLASFPFPFTPITDEFYELGEGWDWADTTTRQLIRNGGWLVRNTSGNVTAHYAAVKSTGSTESNDQLYYIIDGTSGASAATNFYTTGPINTAIQVIDDPNGDGAYGDGFSRTGELVVFNREYDQLYSRSSTLLNGESTTAAPKVYSLDASTGTDVNIDVADTGIDADSNGTADVAPFTNMSITYIPHQNRGAYANSTVYNANDVVQDVGDSQGNGADRWYITTAGGTSNGANLAADSGVTWTSFSGERLVGSAYYAFGVIIDGNQGSKQQIYEFVQWSLRQNVDIDAGSGTQIGNVADPLLQFVGSQLKTVRQLDDNGVFIDDYQAGDANDLVFVDDTGTERTFPRTATVKLSFSSTLQNDAAAKYFVFFTDPDQTPDGDEWGTSGGILVPKNGGGDMTGTVGGASEVQLSYDFDNDSTGGRALGSDTPITCVAIGEEDGQYIRNTGTIVFPEVTVSLIAPQERNYDPT